MKMNKNEIIRKKNFLPLLKGVVVPIASTIVVIVFLLLGVPIYIVLALYSLWSAFTHFFDGKKPKEYLNDSFVLLSTLVLISWIYFIAGGYGLIGLAFALLSVTGLILYRRKNLIISLVQLWEKTFLGETMEERLDRKRAKP